MEPGIGISVRDLLFGCVGLLVMLLAWFGSMLYNKVEKKVDKQDYKETMVELKAEFRDSMDRQTKLLIHLFNTIKGDK